MGYRTDGTGSSSAIELTDPARHRSLSRPRLNDDTAKRSFCTEGDVVLSSRFLTYEAGERLVVGDTDLYEIPSCLTKTISTNHFPKLVPIPTSSAEFHREQPGFGPATEAFIHTDHDGEPQFRYRGTYKLERTAWRGLESVSGEINGKQVVGRVRTKLSAEYDTKWDVQA